jgi:hypothetical protein
MTSTKIETRNGWIIDAPAVIDAVQSALREGLPHAAKAGLRIRLKNRATNCRPECASG